MTNYRKIWKNHHGTIPFDDDRRTYEIHHKDGDRENNDIENLQLVTIHEHYDIHYSQGDWAACQSIAFRLNLTPEDHSNRQSELAKRRLAAGTHPFVDPTIRAIIDKKTGEREREKIKNGTSQLFSTAANEKRIKSHKDAVAAGTHHTLTIEYASSCREVQNSLASEGLHNFQLTREKQKEAIHKMITDGCHPLQSENRTDPNKIKVSCIVCKKETTLPALSSHHKHEGSSRENPGSIKVSCTVCHATTSLGGLTRWHSNCKESAD